MAQQGSLTVADKTTNIGGIVIDVAPTGTPVTSLAVTNRSGRSYYVDKNGAAHEVPNLDFGSGEGKRQASMSFTVTIRAKNAAGDAYVDLTTAMVKQVAAAGDLVKYVKVTAEGAVKIDLNQTTKATTASDNDTATFDDSSKVGFNVGSETKLAHGVLGVDHGANFNVMKITFKQSDGSIDISSDAGNSWTTHDTVALTQVDGKYVCAAGATASFYYGLEAQVATAEATPSVVYSTETNQINPSIADS